jgi:hypothetical protein
MIIGSGRQVLEKRHFVRYKSHEYNTEIRFGASVKKLPIVDGIKARPFGIYVK